MDDVGEGGLLIGEFLEEGFAGTVVGEGSEGLGIGAGIQLTTDLLLIAGEFAGILAEFAGGVLELVGGLASEILAEFVELGLGTGPGGESLGDLTLLGGFGGAFHLLPGFLEAFAFLGHAGLVLAAFHALLEFIGIGEVLALFLLEFLELALDLFALFFVGGLEGGLEFLELLVHLLLALGEFLEAIDGLELFAAFVIDGSASLGLGFVTVLGLGEIEFVHLALVALVLGLGLRLGL